MGGQLSGDLGKALTVTSAVVAWVLKLTRTPLPAVGGGLSMNNAVVNALPKERKKLREAS